MNRLARLVAAGLLLAPGAVPVASAASLVGVEVVGARAISLAVTDLDPARCCGRPQDVLVDREPSGAAVTVDRVGVDRQVVGLEAHHGPVTVTRVHLLFAQRLTAGEHYRVRIPSLALGGKFEYQPDRRSRAIAVNQLGYAPAARKLALVGDWLGTLGPLPIDEPAFEIVDDQGATAYRGTLTLRRTADPWSGDDVWVADFTPFARGGRWRVKVPGLGTSDPFEIRADVYDVAYRTVMRVLYHQRNSTPIDAAHAAPGYARPGGVPSASDAVFDAAVGASRFGHREIAGANRPVRRGWFDAGDYGQYVVNAAPLWHVVAVGLDLLPQAFRDGDLSIPESGNGLPDVLDELEWGFDWMLSMQDRADGGVYSRVASEQWDEGLPMAVTRPRLIAEKTSHATASFAAVAAIHARLLSKARPERAAAALAAARAAWRFLDSHEAWPAEGERYHNRPGMHAGEYADATLLDNRLWAAAELWRTTGEETYRLYFESHFSAVHLDPTGDPTYADSGMAAVWAYLRGDPRQRDSAVLAAARRAVISGADWRMKQMESHPWFAPTHPRRALVGWGNFAQSTRAVLSLLEARSLTGDRRYLEAAWLAPGVELGLNPQGLCYITGLGARSPHHPLSKLSLYSGHEEPLPGIPVHGPHARLPGSWPSTRVVNAGYFPATHDESNDNADDGFPVLRRYTDSSELPPMSEPTIAEIARIGIAFGLLRDAGLDAGAPQQ